MQRLYRRRLSVFSLFDEDFSTLGIRITVGSESEILDFQTCVDFEFPRQFP